MRDNGKEDAIGREITRKRTLGKGGGGGGADKRGGAHSRYQFFRCGKIGGRGRINDGGALWRYSTVHAVIDLHYKYMYTVYTINDLLPLGIVVEKVIHCAQFSIIHVQSKKM